MKDSKIIPQNQPPRILLRCPRCRMDNVEDLRCPDCGFCMPMEDGIVRALPPERAAHYARFIDDYEHIRAAEGRGSQDERFYLRLPYQDTTGCNSLQWKIRARSYDYLMRHVLSPGLRGGTILDLGAGNCWMSFRLAIRSYRPVAVDLLTNSNDGLGAATHYRRYLSSDIQRFQAELNGLPFREAQFDAVIFNASFHYSEDYEATLREALRCLKPDGIVVISDTPWYSCEESGRQMISERRARFQKRFQTASDSVKSLEFLTDNRLKALEQVHGVQWTVHRPWYGWRWAMRPWAAKLRGRREPSQFRIYVARKHA